MDSQATPPLSKPSNHHLVPVAITVVAFILIVLIGIYTVTSFQRKPAEDPQKLTAQQDDKAYSFPRITVDKWTVEDSARTNPTSATATIYTLNAKPTKADFNSLLFNFFRATSTNETDKSYRAFSDQGGSSMLYLQKDTGSFLYKSSAGFPIASGSGALDESRRIVAFAQQALNDDTLASFATYQKKSIPNTTYYELHRDWNRLGYPLFNLFGVLNLKETQLKGLSLYQPTNNVVADSDIVNTSDKTDGFKRPNDFNTVTIGVRDGKVVDVISNLRMFPRSARRPATDKIISYSDAVKKLTSNEYSKLYTSPAGEGAVDREKMYPQNKASLAEATVTESAIAYLEELPGVEQGVLAPYYVFRGTGTLSTGYRVTFVATVPAAEKNVLGTATIAQFDTTQKQGTLEMEEPPPQATDAPNAPGTTNAPQQQNPAPRVSLPPTNSVCDERPSSLSELYNVQTDDASGITFGQYDITPPGGQQVPNSLGWFGPQWFAVTQSNHDINQLNKVIDLASGKLGLRQDTTGDISGGDVIRDYDDLLSEWENSDVSCPVRITGRSPSLFIYSPGRVKVDLPSNVTYADPATTDNTWTVTAATDYLYYEYSRIPFNKPTAGWYVTKSEIPAFAARVAASLKLNRAETERLVHELRNASQDVHTNKLFIGLIDRYELEAQLPLRLTPEPVMAYRFHFHLSTAGTTPVSAPLLTPVTRSSYTVVELGATD